MYKNKNESRRQSLLSYNSWPHPPTHSRTNSYREGRERGGGVGCKYPRAVACSYVHDVLCVAVTIDLLTVGTTPEAWRQTIEDFWWSCTRRPAPLSRRSDAEWGGCRDVRVERKGSRHAAKHSMHSYTLNIHLHTWHTAEHSIPVCTFDTAIHSTCLGQKLTSNNDETRDTRVWGSDQWSVTHVTQTADTCYIMLTSGYNEHETSRLIDLFSNKISL